MPKFAGLVNSWFAGLYIVVHIGGNHATSSQYRGFWWLLGRSGFLGLGTEQVATL